jgi:plastocyanin
MIKVALQSIRRPVSWMVVACLAILVFALAACGGDGSSTTSSSSGSAGNASSNNVSSGNASSSGPVASVNIKEKKGSSGADVYMCDPTTLSVKKGDTVAFTNMSDEKQDFDQGDAEKAGVDFVMDLNQSTKATFKNAGTFTIKSEKGAVITVTVS